MTKTEPKTKTESKTESKAKTKVKADGIQYCDPFDLVLVGIAPDHPAIGEHDHVFAEEYPADLEPFADPDRLRAEPIEAYEEAAENVSRFGVRVPVLVKEHNGKLYVTDGRQRVIWARLATLVLREKGDEIGVRVPVTIDKGSDALVTQIICNEHRKEDSVVAKARKAQRARERGASEEEIQALFGVTRQTLANWKAILGCIPSILARVEAGEIPVQTAIKIGQLPANEQWAALSYVEERGGTLRGSAGAENIAAAAAAVTAQQLGENAAEGDVSTSEPSTSPAPKPEIKAAGRRKLTTVQIMRVRARLNERLGGKSFDDLNFEDAILYGALLALRKASGDVSVDLSEVPALAEAFGE